MMRIIPKFLTVDGFFPKIWHIFQLAKSLKISRNLNKTADVKMREKFQYLGSF